MTKATRLPPKRPAPPAPPKAAAASAGPIVDPMEADLPGLMRIRGQKLPPAGRGTEFAKPSGYSTLQGTPDSLEALRAFCRGEDRGVTAYALEVAPAYRKLGLPQFHVWFYCDDEKRVREVEDFARVISSRVDDSGFEE